MSDNMKESREVTSKVVQGISRLTSSRNGRGDKSSDGVDPRHTGDSRNGRSSSLHVNDVNVNSESLPSLV